jgi:hypothetical protein
MRAKDPRIDTNEPYQVALEENVAFVPCSMFDPDGNDHSGDAREFHLQVAGSPRRRRAPAGVRNQEIFAQTRP